jgi:hypothetical protein
LNRGVECVECVEVLKYRKKEYQQETIVAEKGGKREKHECTGWIE